MAGFVTYIKETVEELRHNVTWPTWSELQQSAVLVLIASVIFSLLIFGMDKLFGIHTPSANSWWQWKGLLGWIYEMLT